MNPQSANGKIRDIRVLLVDDSALSLEIIRRMLAGAPEIRVVGTAANGVEALELIPQVHPDVICTDLHMPKMDGLELTRVVMTRSPLPILVLSVSVRAEQSQNIFQMLEAGALDVLAKPVGGLESDFGIIANDLITKIRILSGVKVIGKRKAVADAAAKILPPSLSGLTTFPPRIIGIGASTGGPQALERILGQLPADFPLPLLCVQHIAEGFMQGLVAWLAASCRIRVRTANEGAQPLAGTAYFPPNDRHLEIDDAGEFRCSAALPFSGHRPSVDIAFSSLARRYSAAAAGVLLTGMGQDGAQGMLDISRAGGLTIAQDEGSSVVFGMPKRAIELGAARHVLSLDRIGPALCEFAARSS
jgi:two-component system, chemotaxis family, protein-glutamate methylesterase/glutaminase